MSTFQPWRTFKPEETGTPHTWIQWKGTAVCMDLYCRCGHHSHFDDEFCYYIQCPKCNQIYEMSGHVEAHPVDAVPPGSGDPRTTNLEEDT